MVEKGTRFGWAYALTGRLVAYREIGGDCAGWRFGAYRVFNIVIDYHNIKKATGLILLKAKSINGVSEGA